MGVTLYVLNLIVCSYLSCLSSVICTGTCLQLFARWRRSDHLKLSQLKSQQSNVLNRQRRQSLNFFSCKLLDGITCLPVPT